MAVGGRGDGENANSLDQPARQDRGSMDPVQRFALREQFARVRAENGARLLAAFKPLYASLSPEQQQVPRRILSFCTCLIARWRGILWARVSQAAALTACEYRAAAKVQLRHASRAGSVADKRAATEPGTCTAEVAPRPHERHALSTDIQS
jgi:hypothetical protein